MVLSYTGLELAKNLTSSSKPTLNQSLASQASNNLTSSIG